MSAKDYKKGLSNGAGIAIGKYKQKILSDDLLDNAFMEYLERALIVFEDPHQKTVSEKLEVYKQAFKNTIKSLLEKSKSGNNKL